MVGFLMPLLMGGMALASMFGGQRSKKEKKLFAGQEALSQEQMAAGRKGQQSIDGMADGFQNQARGTRNQRGFAQSMDYWSALMGGDRSKMMNAVAPQRAMVGETYKGAKGSLGKSRLRGQAKVQAEANLDQQQTGQLAGLTQGLQGQAAEQMSNTESQIQQIMQAYSGLGLNAKTQGYNVLAQMLGDAGYTQGGLLNNETNYRQTRQAQIAQAGAQLGGSLAGYVGGKQGAGPAGGGLNNAMGSGSRAAVPQGWRLPQGNFNLQAQGPRMGNGSVNAWGVPTYGGMVGTGNGGVNPRGF